HGSVPRWAFVLPLPRSLCFARDGSFYGGSWRPMKQELMVRFFSYSLWFAGLGHFLILAAGFQVPVRLQWKKDLQSLLPFNRKLLWVQGSFTVLTIIAFGILTLVLHKELLEGDKAALSLACFIGIYWLARILVDAFYFSHQDWPKGRLFVMGH